MYRSRIFYKQKMHIKQEINAHILIQREEYNSSARSFRCAIRCIEIKGFINLCDGAFLWVMFSFKIESRMIVCLDLERIRWNVLLKFVYIVSQIPLVLSILRLLWNHWISQGPVLVYCSNFTGPWGRNFVYFFIPPKGNMILLP